MKFNKLLDYETTPITYDEDGNLLTDAHLDDERLHFKVRDTTTKNRKPAIVPLHEKLIEDLRSIQGNNGVFVFPQNCNPDRWFGRHTDLAKFKRIDATGRKIDFHSLRYTFATKLARQGVS